MPKSKNSKSISKAVELLQLLPKRKSLPGENVSQMTALEQALIAELAPATPLEHVIVDDLFNLLCDAIGHRRYRDALLRAGARRLAEGAFHHGQIKELDLFETDKEAEQLSKDLVGEDPGAQEHALAELAKRNVSIDEVIAQAYASRADHILPHEAQIAESEERRRKLLEQFFELKAARATPVEDAILVQDG